MITMSVLTGFLFWWAVPCLLIFAISLAMTCTKNWPWPYSFVFFTFWTVIFLLYLNSSSMDVILYHSSACIAYDRGRVIGFSSWKTRGAICGGAGIFRSWTRCIGPRAWRKHSTITHRQQLWWTMVTHSLSYWWRLCVRFTLLACLLRFPEIFLDQSLSVAGVAGYRPVSELTTEVAWVVISTWFHLFCVEMHR